MLRVMCCSQKTCSGHCMAALLVMRFIAKKRLVLSSLTWGVGGGRGGEGRHLLACLMRGEGWHLPQGSLLG